MVSCVHRGFSRASYCVAVASPSGVGCCAAQSCWPGGGEEDCEKEGGGLRKKERKGKRFWRRLKDFIGDVKDVKGCERCKRNGRNNGGM